MGVLNYNRFTFVSEKKNNHYLNLNSVIKSSIPNYVKALNKYPDLSNKISLNAEWIA